MTSPDKSGITVGTRSYTTHWDTIIRAFRAKNGFGGTVRHKAAGTL